VHLNPDTQVGDFTTAAIVVGWHTAPVTLALCFCTHMPASRSFALMYTQIVSDFVLQDAEEAYSQALSHQTSRAVLWANRSAARLSSGKAAAALADARLARTVDPQYMKVSAPLCLCFLCCIILEKHLACISFLVVLGHCAPVSIWQYGISHNAECHRVRDA